MMKFDQSRWVFTPDTFAVRCPMAPLHPRRNIIVYAVPAKGEPIYGAWEAWSNDTGTRGWGDTPEQALADWFQGIAPCWQTVRRFERRFGAPSLPVTLRTRFLFAMRECLTESATA